MIDEKKDPVGFTKRLGGVIVPCKCATQVEPQEFCCSCERKQRPAALEFTLSLGTPVVEEGPAVHRPPLAAQLHHPLFCAVIKCLSEVNLVGLFAELFPEFA